MVIIEWKQQTSVKITKTERNILNRTFDFTAVRKIIETILFGTDIFCSKDSKLDFRSRFPLFPSIFPTMKI